MNPRKILAWLCNREGVPHVRHPNRITSGQPARRLQLEPLECRQLLTVVATSNAPWKEALIGQVLAPMVDRPGGANNPTILYDATASDPNKLFKMYWAETFTGASPQDTESSPADLRTTDRVYYAYSSNGSTWSQPYVVVAPMGSTIDGVTADDHLVGAPSLLKLGSTYYMAIEAYPNWVSSIVEFHSSQRKDSWAIGGRTANYPFKTDSYTDFDNAYRPGQSGNSQLSLGFVPAFKKAGTHAIYTAEVTYQISGHTKYNRFLTADPNLWSQLDGFRLLNDGKPTFWAYDAPAPGREALNTYFDSVNANTYARTVSQPHPGTFVETLGYVNPSLGAADLAFANQNTVVLLKSTDGEHWERVPGASFGGSILAPQNPYTLAFDRAAFDAGQPPHPYSGGENQFDVHCAYGFGYPVLIVHDDFVELFFAGSEVVGDTQTLWTTRVPLAQLENGPAWFAASANKQQIHSGIGFDMAWSGLYERYFGSEFDQVGTANDKPLYSGNVIWSNFVAWPGIFMNPGNRVFSTYEFNGRGVGASGFLRDGLGHFVEQVNEARSDIHLVTVANPLIDNGNVHTADIDRMLVFAYGQILPTVRAGGPYEFRVGEGVTLDASSSTFTSPAGLPLFYSWDINGDGNFGDAYGSQVTLSEGQLSALGLNHAGQWQVRVRTDDGQVGIAFSQPTSLTARLSEGEIDVQRAGVSIVDGDASPSAADGTDFGTTPGQWITRQFTIQNTGTGTLNLGTVTLSPASGNWAITQQPAATVAPGGSTTFKVRFQPTTGGFLQATVNIPNNDPNENPYDFVVRGYHAAPGARIERNNLLIPDGSTTPTIDDGSDFTAAGANVSAERVTREFTVKNTGLTTLTLGSVSVTTGTPSEWAVTQQPATILSGGASTTFRVRFQPTTTGLATGTVHLPTSDPVYGDYTFDIRGVGTDATFTAEIEIRRGVIVIVDGDTSPSTTDGTDFGSAQANNTNARITRQFTIYNLGIAPLVLKDPLRVAIDSASPADWKVTKLPDGVIQPGGGTTFNVRFQPTSAGLKTATIRILNTDGNESPYDFAIQGLGTSPFAAALAEPVAHNLALRDAVWQDDLAWLALRAADELLPRRERRP